MIGEIKRHIRDDGPVKVSRIIKELGIKIKEIQRQYLNKKGEEITIKELQKELKVGKEEIILAIEATRNVESIEDATYINHKDGNSISLKDKITTEKDEEEIITNKIAINELIKGLKKREQEVILLRFYKEKTQAQVAKILGITPTSLISYGYKLLGDISNKMMIIAVVLSCSYILLLVLSSIKIFKKKDMVL